MAHQMGFKMFENGFNFDWPAQFLNEQNLSIEMDASGQIQVGMRQLSTISGYFPTYGYGAFTNELAVPSG